MPDSNRTTPLKEFSVNIRTKLAALWTSVTFCYLYGDYFELYTPDKVQSLISGENVLNSPMSLFIAALIMAIPPLMIFLSLASRPKLSKGLNIVVGLIFTLMMLLIAVGSLSPWFSFYVFLAILEAVLTAMVVWYALKWPRQESAGYD